VIELGANGDLRRFLERDFFTKWHLKWYRKRPVYWPLQSAKRSYGFVLFHERIDRTTLYTLQREYLDHKLNGLRLEIGDLRGRLAGAEGRARQGHDLVEEANQVDGLAAQRRLLVEVDPAGEEVLGAPRSAAYGDRVPLLLGTLLQGADQELRVAAHEGDQVAEIVRDAARPDLKVRLVAPSFPRISRIRHVLPLLMHGSPSMGDTQNLARQILYQGLI